MAAHPAERQARRLALAVPLALLAGAWLFQYVGHLVPCEMCWWQRYACLVALPFALAGLLVRRVGLARVATGLAALALLADGGIALFHAGVENKWWPGLTRCALPTFSSGNFLADVMATPLVRCDEAQWRLIGISLAGWNAIIAIPFGLWILWQTSFHRR